MIAIELKKGEHLVRKGESTKAIYIVLRGSVYLQTAYNQITLGSGSVLGFMIGVTEEYICDYVAAEDSLIASYKYESPEDYKVIFQEQPKYCYAFLHAAISQYRIIYDSYRALKDAAKEISNFIATQYAEYEQQCTENYVEPQEVEAIELAELFLPEPIRKWELGYFNDLVDLPEKTLRYFYNDKEDLTIGVLLQLAEIMVRMIANMDTLCEYMQHAKECLISEEEDLLELWYDLAVKLAMKQIDTILVDVKVKELEAFLKHTSFYKEEEIAERLKQYFGEDFKNYAITHSAAVDEDNEDGEVAETLTREQVLRTDFTKYVMEYAGYEKEEILECKQLIKEYGEIAEIQDYTPEMQKVRRTLTKKFYEIYEKAFLRAVHARSISTVMKLFFNFGVLDLQMAGVSHLDELMAVSELLDNQFQQQKERDAAGDNFTHVYTIFQYLILSMGLL